MFGNVGLTALAYFQSTDSVSDELCVPETYPSMAPGRIKRTPDNIYDPNRKQTQTARVAVGGASTGCGPLFLRRARDLYVTTGSSSQSNRTLYIRDRFYFIFTDGPRAMRDQFATSHQNRE